MMKKFTFLFTILMFLATGLSAQYTLLWDGEQIGDTIIVQGAPSETELVFEAVLANNSDNTVGFMLQRRLINLLEGTTTSYCWGTSCFPPNNTDVIDVASDTVYLAPGESTGEGTFSGHYLAEDFGELDVNGTSMIEYKFFNAENPDDNVTVVVEFVTGLYTLTWNMDVFGDTVTIEGDPSATELVFEAVLTNNSEDTVAFKLQRRLIFLLDGTTTSYCWGTSCFPPNNVDSIDVARDTVLLAPDQTTPEGKFSGHYLAEDFGELGVAGTSMIEYKFFNEENEDDNVTIVVKFVTTTDGIVDQLMSNAFISDLYPNPATSFVTINYDLPQEVTSASVRIFNILGSVVKTETLNKNASSLRMDISDLTNGVYFYSIVINNEVYKTKKLIVK